MENSAPSDMDTGTTPVTSAINSQEKSLATIVYVLQILSLFVGITSIVGVIMNYVKRGDLTDEVVRSHFSYQIRTFWWALVWSILGAIFAMVTFGIGGIALVIVAVWYVYRIVKGWMRLNDGKAI